MITSVWVKSSGRSTDHLLVAAHDFADREFVYLCQWKIPADTIPQRSQDTAGLVSRELVELYSNPLFRGTTRSLRLRSERPSGDLVLRALETHHRSDGDLVSVHHFARLVRRKFTYSRKPRVGRMTHVNFFQFRLMWFLSKRNTAQTLG